MRSAFLILLLGMAILGGCATPPPPAPDPDRAADLHAARLPALQALTDWSIKGRIGLSSEVESWHADLRWRQSEEHYLINLAGPFGQGRVKIEGRPGLVTLETEDRVFRDLDADRLINRRLGWQVPVRGLNWWVRGMASPRMADPLSREFDERGRLLRLSQGGWIVEFLRYRDVDGLQLPDKVFAENPEWKVRIVIADYKVGS
ncbi:MAG: lipoprotein insertase outer membrane protein LolB [Gammaproteobacteria bacterium]